MTKRNGVFRCGRRSAILANSAGPWAWTRGSQMRPPQPNSPRSCPGNFSAGCDPAIPRTRCSYRYSRDPQNRTPRRAFRPTQSENIPATVSSRNTPGEPCWSSILCARPTAATAFGDIFPTTTWGRRNGSKRCSNSACSTDVEELILSGGDPLTLSDERFKQLCQAAAAIPQLKRLRIHSRLPILIPARVTASLLRLLTDLRLSVWMVVHVNHPQEIDDSVAEALTAFRQAGIPVLNQSVLMRDVNDSSETLIELSRRLVNLGVLPYYIHQLDRVQGAHHFEVAEVRGRQIVRELRSSLPGYAVPRYVREVAGEPSKVGLD